MMKEPLLKGDVGQDLETGNARAKREAETGTMTCQELIEFFTKKEHMCTALMASLCAALLLGFILDCLTIQAVWTGRHPHMKTSFIFFVSVSGLTGSVYSAFIREQLQDEVNKQSELQAKLAKNVGRLKSVRNDLTNQTASMNEELTKFNILKGKLEQFEAQGVSGFSEIFNRVSNTLGETEELLKNQMREILSKVAQSYELQDDEDGLTREEWEEFLERLPRSQDASITLDFDTLSNEKGVVSIEKCQAVIDKVIASLDDLSSNALFSNAKEVNAC